jgi:hypothetical protein
MANVPIVTEVTKLELDALVAANALNEGLQYKVTDKNWLLLAISTNTYKYIESTPYKSVVGLLSQSGTSAPTIDFIHQEFNITANYVSVGDYTLQISFTENKIFGFLLPNNPLPNEIILLYQNDGEFFNILTRSSTIPSNDILFNTPFEIRIYLI